MLALALGLPSLAKYGCNRRLWWRRELLEGCRARADPLLLHCRFEPCTNVTAEVYLRAYLSPCINDCGIYGQCKLLRTNNYLYAACECKAGESFPGHPWCPLHPGTPPASSPPPWGLCIPLVPPRQLTAGH